MLLRLAFRAARPRRWVKLGRGRADGRQSDKDLVAAALRETHEELALPPERVTILGALDAEYSLGNLSRVWPVVVSAASSSKKEGS